MATIIELLIVVFTEDGTRPQQKQPSIYALVPLKLSLITVGRASYHFLICQNTAQYLFLAVARIT